MFKDKHGRSFAMKRDPNNDAVSHVLHFASDIFKKECKDNLIDVTESIKNIKQEHATHKKDDGVVFIAWRLDHNTNSVEGWYRYLINTESDTFLFHRQDG